MKALQILSKKGGKYLVLQIDEAYEPGPIETRTVYGINFTQGRNDFVVNPKGALEQYKSTERLAATARLCTEGSGCGNDSTEVYTVKFCMQKSHSVQES